MTACRNIQTPKNVDEIQQFIGWVNYFTRFLPKVLDTAKPLRDLTCEKKSVAIYWLQSQTFRNNFLKIVIKCTQKVATYVVETSELQLESIIQTRERHVHSRFIVKNS